MTDSEVSEWKARIHSLGAEPFVTKPLDIEGYFATEAYLQAEFPEISSEDATEIFASLAETLEERAIEDYVNGRVDIERKKGQGVNINLGSLANVASKLVKKDVLAWTEGKVALSALRGYLQSKRSWSLPIRSDPSLVDNDLRILGEKFFPMKSA